MNEDKQLAVADEYKEMFKVAHDLTDQEKNIPLDKHQTINDRYQMHMIDMLTMYTAKYGMPETLDQILDRIESLIFNGHLDATVKLTMDMWMKIRTEVHAGALLYKDITKPLPEPTKTTEN